MSTASTPPIAVIGAGAWGTALALVLARRGHAVGLWVYEAELAEAMRQRRENHVYLSGFKLPEAIHPTADLGETVAGAHAVVMAVPSMALRSTLTRLRAVMPAGTQVLLATKGLEATSLMRVSQVAEAVLGEEIAPRLATLSGPTFAREVAAGEPAAVVIAARNPVLAAGLQQRLSSAELRLYTTGDVVGVELAGALKNVIAIAAGICQGLGLGSNTRAALIARGLAEMSRLITAAGGEASTAAGLAGLGDLVLTCTGELSRNRQVGIALGQGQKLAEILAARPTVAEGVHTAAAAAALARRLGVEMPITEQMRRVLFDGQPPRTALAELMQRPLARE